MSRLRRYRGSGRRARGLTKGGLPTERLVAHVLAAKYAWHLPLYRQSQMMAKQGLAIDRTKLAFWVGYAGAELAPVYQRLKANLLATFKIVVDETPAPVLDLSERLSQATFATRKR